MGAGGPSLSRDHGKKQKQDDGSSVILTTMVAVTLGLMVVIMLTAGSCVQEEQIVAISIRNEIERAFEVKGLENKFVYVERGVFSGAGAGGLGAPQIFTKSAKQFSELVPIGEPVYVALKYKNCCVLKKVYWAFIENRAGLIIYEDVYSYDENNKKSWWRIKNYDSQNVTFHRILPKFSFLAKLLGKT